MRDDSPSVPLSAGTVPEHPSGTTSWFDVERFRTLTARSVLVRRVDRPMVVLGSTQPESVVDRPAAAAAGVAVVRRRSGGGAVLVHPHDPLWIDVWLPRHDALWQDDVVLASVWVGEWWAAALSSAAVRAVSVHRASLVATPHSDLVCFAGRGPGEVFVAGRKVMGLTQWRSRQGALFQCAAYRRWDPAQLTGLLRVPSPERAALTQVLRSDVAGLDELPRGRARAPRGDGAPGRKVGRRGGAGASARRCPVARSFPAAVTSRRAPPFPPTEAGRPHASRRLRRPTPRTGGRPVFARVSSCQPFVLSAVRPVRPVFPSAPRGTSPSLAGAGRGDGWLTGGEGRA